MDPDLLGEIPLESLAETNRSNTKLVIEVRARKSDLQGLFRFEDCS
jgi:hypothetical protein